MRKPPRPPYTRNRSQNSTTVVGGWILGERVSIPGGARTVYQNAARNAIITNQDTMSDVVTPGYKRLISDGQVVSRPMSQVRTTYQCSDSGVQVKNTTSTYVETWDDAANIMYWYYGMPTAPTLGNIDVENLVRYSNTKALAGARSSQFQGMVTLAESAKTLRMILSPLSSISKLLAYVIDQRKQKRNLRIDSTLNGEIRINGRVFHKATGRGRHKGPGREVTTRYPNIVVPFGDAVSGTVLMHNLGLRPLMADIEFLTKDIRDLHTKSERLTSRGSEMDSASSTTSTTKTSASAIITYQTLQTTKISVRSWVSWFDKFDVLEDHGMSIYDIPSTVYELIPFSFVLDYFVNLGTLLEAQRAIATQKFWNGGHTVRIENTTERIFTGGSGVAPWVLTRAPTGGDKISVITKARTIQFPEAGLAFKPLSRAFRPAVVQNLLALTVQQLMTLGKKPGAAGRTPFY